MMSMFPTYQPNRRDTGDRQLLESGSVSAIELWYPCDDAWYLGKFCVGPPLFAGPGMWVLDHVDVSWQELHQSSKALSA